MTRNRWRRDGRPLVIAHRGHLTGAPEQTLAAFTAAVALGVDMIEADVQRTRDGHLVLLHDATLDRTTDGHGLVADISFAELRALDAGSWFAAEFAGAQVPALSELFDLATAHDIGLCLEAKGETADERALLVQLVAEQVALRGRLDRDVVASFDHAALAAAVAARPRLVAAPDRLPERGPSSADVLIEQARRAGAPIIQHHFADLAADVVAAVQAAGIAVWAWPPTSTAEVEQTCALGVDAVMGDDAAVLTAVVDAHADGVATTSAAQPEPAEA